MEELRVRVYNVEFGDAILVSFPDQGSDGVETIRHLLIDVGNVLRGRAGVGGNDDLFGPLVDDLNAELAGRPLDLYVMTHEHMDHVQGLYYADVRLDKRIAVDYAWITVSAAPDYYETHPAAEQQRRLALTAYQRIAAFLDAARLGATPAEIEQLDRFESLRLNNNILAPAAFAARDPNSTAQCVAYLRARAQIKTSYIFRGADLADSHPFHEARLSVWAPEEDSAIYYGRFQPMALFAGPDGADITPAPLDYQPPPGVDAGAFYDLVALRRGGFQDNLLAIDRAANNSSIVFCLEWRGWRLLFPGDAELRSWSEMQKRGLLQQIHFLKVAHHGSHNGTPLDKLDQLLAPAGSVDGRDRCAVISTCADVYNDVPDPDLAAGFGTRCRIFSVVDPARQPTPSPDHFDLHFDPASGRIRASGWPAG